MPQVIVLLSGELTEDINEEVAEEDGAAGEDEAELRESETWMVIALSWECLNISVFIGASDGWMASVAFPRRSRP